MPLCPPSAIWTVWWSRKIERSYPGWQVGANGSRMFSCVENITLRSLQLRFCSFQCFCAVIFFLTCNLYIQVSFVIHGGLVPGASIDTKIWRCLRLFYEMVQYKSAFQSHRCKTLGYGLTAVQGRAVSPKVTMGVTKTSTSLSNQHIVRGLSS